MLPIRLIKKKGNYRYHEWTKDHQRRYRTIDTKVDNKRYYEQPDSNAADDLNEMNKFHFTKANWRRNRKWE